MVAAFFVDFLKYILEIVAANACFAGGMERKDQFRLRCLCLLLVSVVTALLMATIAAHVQMGDYGAVSALVYSVLSAIAIWFVFFCFRDTVWNRLFCCITGNILRMCAKKLFDIIIVGWKLAGMDEALVQKGAALRYVIYYPILLLTYGLAFLYLGRMFQKGRSFSMDGKTVAVYLVVLFINLILNNIEAYLLASDLRHYGLLVFCEFAYYILILCMQSFLFRIARAETESRVTQELWRQDRRQYENIRENIEIINIKCHDLRHQIRTARESGRVEEDFLREVEQSIVIYDSSVKSGNETLDVILTDKRLHCEAAGIQLTCMVAGRRLGLIERSDIISLFGNLLENAIEYESSIPEKEKRFISLTVRPVEQFLSVHVENYYEGTLELKDGLPVTAKADRTYHGYGLRSVSRIVKKYGGNMKIGTADGMFQLSILFPLAEA